MKLTRLARIASSIALAGSLEACGGAGPSAGIISTPAPTAAPSPAPTAPPTATAASISTPALAAMPNSALLPMASVGGATTKDHPKTLFPLLQSVISIGPAGVQADTATTSAGATLAFDSSDKSYVLDIANPALGIANVVLNSTPSSVFSTDVTGGKHVSLEIANPATTNLSWTSFGYWDIALQNGARTQAQFVTGYAPPPDRCRRPAPRPIKGR